MTWEDVAVRVLLLLSVAANVLLFMLWGYTLKQWKEAVELWGKSVEHGFEAAGALEELIEDLKRESTK